MSWMQTWHWVGAVIAAVVCGVAASVLLNVIMRPGPGKKATGVTWYATIRAFPPGCVVGALVFLSIVQPGDPEIDGFTATPQRVTQGQEIVLRAEAGDNFDQPKARVEFRYVPRDSEEESWRYGIGDDTDGSDGWQVRFKTDRLKPGEYTVFARARTEYGGSEEESVRITVDPAPAGGGK